MEPKLLIGLAVVLGLLLIAWAGGDRAEPGFDELPEPVPAEELVGQLVSEGRFVLEQGGVPVADESYTILYHPDEGYMLVSQGTLAAGEETVHLAQQARFDQSLRPVFYHLTAETPSGTQVVSAQRDLQGLRMSVQIGSATQESVLPDAGDLVLLDNHLISHYVMLLMAIRTETVDRACTAAVPQGLLSLPVRIEGPTRQSFVSGDETYEGNRFDVYLGDLRIGLIEHLDQLAVVVNRSQNVIAYDVGLFPDGVAVPALEEATPEPVSSLEERSLSFSSEGVRLAGTLALPKGTRPVAAVLFLPGSGPVDRDGNAPGMSMDAYRQLAHALADGGIASLRYDKRGVGESEGELASASVADLVMDAVGALAALQAAPEVDPESIVLVGHSEGAYLVPRLLRVQSAAGAALLCGAARPLDEITWWQIETLLQRGGASQQQIDAAREQQEAYFEFVEGSAGTWNDYSVADLQRAMPWLTDTAAEELRATPLGLAWLREHYTADTESLLSDVDVPVFVLNGEKDSQVPASEAERIEEILLEAGNTDVVVHVLPDLNHLLRHHPEEPNLLARHLDQPIDPRVSERLQAWIDDVLDR